MKSKGTLFELITQAEMQDLTPITVFYYNEKNNESDFIMPDIINLPLNVIDSMIGKLERFKHKLIKSIEYLEEEIDKNEEE